MITEDYVSFEVAKLLKEKGFDVYTPTRYDYDGGFHSHGDYLIGDNDISAPTHQMAMKWLREEHKIYMEIVPTYSANDFIKFIWQTHNSDYLITGECDICYPTYEKAVEAALKYSLENLI